MERLTKAEDCADMCLLVNELGFEVERLKEVLLISTPNQPTHYRHWIPKNKSVNDLMAPSDCEFRDQMLRQQYNSGKITLEEAFLGLI